jgi:hypothetical protein
MFSRLSRFTWLLIPCVILFGSACRWAPGIRPIPTSTSTLSPKISQPLPGSGGTSLSTQIPKQNQALAKSGSPGQVTQIWSDPQGQLWAAGPGGLFRRQSGNWEEMLSSPVDHILGRDNRGRIWVLSDAGASIGYYLRGHWQKFGSKNGWAPPGDLPYQSPGWGDLAVDAQDQVWFPTGQGELRRFEGRTETWKTFSAAQMGFSGTAAGEESLFIPAVTISSAGKVWVSACASQGEILNGLGVRRLNGGDWVDTPPTLGECVFSMKTAPDGTLWLGGFDKILRYNPDSGEWNKVPLPPGNQTLVSRLDLSPEGLPWVEVIRAGGVSLYGSTQRYHLFQNQWVSDYDPGRLAFSSLTFDRKGQPWLCAAGKLFQPGKPAAFASLDAASCQVVFDAAGQGWVLMLDGKDAGLWSFVP